MTWWLSCYILACSFQITLRSHLVIRQNLWHIAWWGVNILCLLFRVRLLSFTRSSACHLLFAWDRGENFACRKRAANASYTKVLAPNWGQMKDSMHPRTTTTIPYNNRQRCLFDSAGCLTIIKDLRSLTIELSVHL